MYLQSKPCHDGCMIDSLIYACKLTLFALRVALFSNNYYKKRKERQSNWPVKIHRISGSHGKERERGAKLLAKKTRVVQLPHSVVFQGMKEGIHSLL